MSTVTEPLTGGAGLLHVTTAWVKFVKITMSLGYDCSNVNMTQFHKAEEHFRLCYTVYMYLHMHQYNYRSVFFEQNLG